MWCRNCRQDVPGIRAPDDGGMCCAKCHQALATAAGAGADMAAGLDAVRTGDKAEAAGPVPEWAFVERPPIDFDAWQWDQDLHEAERLVRTMGKKRDVHAGHRAGPPAPASRGNSRRSRSGEPRKAVRRSPLVTFLAWSALSLGVMALVFGAVLLGWSCWSGREQLWTLGLPFALGGQAGLILGLVLQLDGVWQSSHDAATALSHLDEQMNELRQATTLLSNTHSGHAQSFYFHLAEGASPHLLLADLKGQLDLLAMRMAKDHAP